jgi:hypothetical protein
LRDSWRARLCSPDWTQAQNREAIRSELGVVLESDSQLTRFRQWVAEQDLMDAEQERQAEEETRIKSAHPEWTLDQVRDEVLKLSLYRAVATGEFAKLGLPAVDRVMRRDQLLLDREKLDLLTRKAAQADQAADITRSELSAEEKAARMRELFA